MLRTAAIATVFCTSLTSACASDAGQAGSTDEQAAPYELGPPPQWVAPQDACRIDPTEPTGLLVTTTDFSTGALSIVDLETGQISSDVALGSTDAIPHWHDGRAYLVHRFGHDFIDVVEPDRWTSLGQHAVEAGEFSSNPHGIAFSEGLAYVTTFGAPSIQIYDLEAPVTRSVVGEIAMDSFSDADGNPEVNLIVGCGTTMYATVQRLARDFSRVGNDAVVVIDTGAGAALDMDPTRPGGQGLPVRGGWIRQFRRDPNDPQGQTLLGLTTGIERIDLRQGMVTWAVTREAFEAAGIAEDLLPQAFDIDDRGAIAYVAAYAADFSEVRLYEVGLDGREPQIPTQFAEGFDSVERSLELVGDQLWYGSTRNDAPGLWIFDTSAQPPQVVAGPLPTGLPPYSLAVIGDR